MYVDLAWILIHAYTLMLAVRLTRTHLDGWTRIHRQRKKPNRTEPQAAKRSRFLYLFHYISFKCGMARPTFRDNDSGLCYHQYNSKLRYDVNRERYAYKYQLQHRCALV